MSFCTRSTFGSVLGDKVVLCEDKDDDGDDEISDDSHFCSLQLLKPGKRSEYLQCSDSFICKSPRFGSKHLIVLRWLPPSHDLEHCNKMQIIYKHVLGVYVYRGLPLSTLSNAISLCNSRHRLSYISPLPLA